MRIGILTYHKSLNNGAFIQCYSLYTRLKKEYPTANVEVIDYTSPKIEKIYPLNIIQYFRGYKKPHAFISRLKRFLKDPKVVSRNRKKKKSFVSCYGELNFSDRCFCHEPLTEIYDYIEQNYDVVVVGSDAVWNYSLRGFPNPYFLNADLKVKKMSYAASCYGMNYENISVQEKVEIKKALDTFAFLGVRDEETANFLASVHCNVSPVHTCDPTVFLDVNALPIDEKDLKNKLVAAGFSFNRDTIGVMGTNEMCRIIRSMYGDKYQVVSLFNYCKNADVNLYHISPFEWAYIFRYFKLTFTTYFHGTLLSLRNGTPVLCIALEDEYTSVHESKVEDFLNRIDLSECYFHLDDIYKNIKAFKAKADELISVNSKEDIIKKMDKEALASFEFFQSL